MVWISWSFLIAALTFIVPPPRWRRVDLRLVLFILRECRDFISTLNIILYLYVEMGLCWSEPPAPPVATNAPTLKPCLSCGVWVKGNDYCEPCLQKNAMRYIAPSAPPMYPPQPQYTYAVMPQQQQQQQMYAYYQARPYAVQPPQAPQQMGVGTAVLGGFVLGAVAEDILDPMD